jgi:hypothetical protein
MWKSTVTVSTFVQRLSMLARKFWNLQKTKQIWDFSLKIIVM